MYGRDVIVISGGGSETIDKAGVCPHSRGGTPKGGPGRRLQLEWKDGVMKNKNIFSTNNKIPRYNFILFLLFVKLEFYYLL